MMAKDSPTGAVKERVSDWFTMGAYRTQAKLDLSWLSWEISGGRQLLSSDLTPNFFFFFFTEAQKGRKFLRRAIWTSVSTL